MKAHFAKFAQKINFWNLFIGFVVGFAAGVWFINLLIPNANQLIKMYRLDYKSRMEDRELRHASSTLRTEIDFKNQ